MIYPLSLPIPLNLPDQSRHEPLPLGPRRRQAADKVPRLLGERDLSLASERFAGSEPSPFEFSPCFAQPQRGGLTGSVRRSQCNRRGFDPSAHMRRRPAKSGAINAIGLPRARFTANEPRRRIGRDTNVAQLPREFLAPLSQRGLADIQTLAVLAYRRDDHMDVGMRCVGMERQDIAVLERQLIAAEPRRTATTELAPAGNALTMTSGARATVRAFCGIWAPLIPESG